MRSPPATVSSRAEHISLEAEPAGVKRMPRGSHRVHSRLRWRSPLRGIESQFELTEDHYLQVRHLQPRRLARQYTVDLRFTQAKPVRIRHVAWITLSLALAFALGAGLVTALLLQEIAVAPREWLAGGGIALATAALATAMIVLHRTTESLVFTSVYGGAALVQITGGLGSARRTKAFCVELIKSINLAHAQVDTAATAYLRDTMREHQRLRDDGALSDAQYEACKARILAAHG